MTTIHNLSYSFENQTLFENLNFHIKAGESVAIIGVSGSGKSILLQLMAQLITPEKGKIDVQLKSFSFVFQNNALFDSFTVLENLLFVQTEVLKIKKKEAKIEAKKILKEVHLGNTESLFPHELSGGMQKRLAIARALITNPELIFYDEPTAGLDPITSKHILTLLCDLNKKKESTIVIATSGFQIAESLSKRIEMIYKKSLLSLEAPPFSDISHPAVKQFKNGLLDGPFTEHL